jgi:hypothetical protein
MKLIKMLGFGMLACAATMACVGATTASADSFCTQSGHHTSECPLTYNGDLLGLTLSAAPALLLTNGEIEEECHGKLLALGSTTVNEGSHKGVTILVDVGDLNFTNCTGLCKKGENINPFWILAEALTLDAFITGDPNKLKVKFYECLFGIQCFYEFSNATQLNAISGDTVASTNVPLTRVAPSSSLCPNNNMKLDVTFLITKDETNPPPIYVAALP